MRLQEMIWREVESYLQGSQGIIIPCGSTEQHGPIGLIGTDALCAATIASGAASKAGAVVAPTLAYTPAPFNMAFPGTISISPELFSRLGEEIVHGLASQGFRRFYFLNAHGANLDPLGSLTPPQECSILVRSWWDFEPVNELRRDYYGDWEGMHATPSEIAITQFTHRLVPSDPIALDPPRKLDTAYITAHAGDRHGPPQEHRRDFPDGRVGSHSALASPEQGRVLLEAAIEAVAADYSGFTTT